MAAERSRRAAPKPKAHVGALAALARVREGGEKRVTSFSIKEEQAVYDVVEEG